VCTVLLVQADTASTLRWRAELASRHFNVIWAPGLQAGIRRLRQGGIDAILVDEPDVQDLADELTTLADSPPFVWLSSSPSAPRRSVELGAAAFFPKPCDAYDVEAIAERLRLFGTPRAVERPLARATTSSSVG